MHLNHTMMLMCKRKNQPLKFEAKLIETSSAPKGASKSDNFDTSNSTRSG